MSKICSENKVIVEKLYGTIIFLLKIDQIKRYHHKRHICRHVRTRPICLVASREETRTQKTEIKVDGQPYEQLFHRCCTPVYVNFQHSLGMVPYYVKYYHDYCNNYIVIFANYRGNIIYRMEKNNLFHRALYSSHLP